jgi:hypothetical protein
MEARQYAARNRQGSDWFSHDSAAAPARPAAAVAPQSPLTPVHTVHSPADGIANIPNRTQPIKPSSDSNSWYKYEGSKQQPVASSDKVAASGSSDKTPEKVNVGSDKTAAEPAVGGSDQLAAGGDKAGGGSGEGQRQRGGSASDWFSHDHSTTNDPGSGHVHGSSKELGANAARMRGESEQWFSHDNTAASTTSPVHAAKGRTGAARPGNSSDMHDVFHHAAGN